MVERKKHAIFLACVLTSVVSLAQGQDRGGANTPRLNQLTFADGFVVGMRFTLERIATTYPDLANESHLAARLFEASALGESVSEIETELSILVGDKWLQLHAQMKSQIQSQLSALSMSREDAVAFIAEVKQRARGELPRDVRAILLSANRRYTKAPLLELKEGWRQTFKTKGHPKAKGVEQGNRI